MLQRRGEKGSQAGSGTGGQLSEYQLAIAVNSWQF